MAGELLCFKLQASRATPFLHIDRWFAFARQLELGIEQLEELISLILVTGCDRALSWLNVAFLKNQADAQVSFGHLVLKVALDGSSLPSEFGAQC